jgi:hypothetical protein
MSALGRIALAAVSLIAFSFARAEPARCIAPPVIADAQVAAQLPHVAAKALDWADTRARQVMVAGTAPTAAQQAIARSVGVRDAARIRIAVVDRIELPDEALLRRAGAQAGIDRLSADGLTLGYAVVLRRGEERNPRLLRHEFRHVAQYEACGGIAPFMASHLGHLLAVGYERSPFEVDAEAYEASGT